MSLVPLHPEAGDDQSEVCWRVPAGVLPLVGAPASVPAGLAALLGSGVLAGVEVRPGTVVTRLAAGRTWRADGPDGS